ncbi:ribonuclease Z [Tenacibaculum holothuriorum]|uniref:Ribonuclease Z n=1 Tax=Tenacibaculum holothuriorum TaxID=1635173 RepID=A0A1Y2P9M5_9FLAO|nr:GLPGLI family protein [Tenacibaculum holothuriorum]OSY86880.1 ribonuclease Z [Tenacibaculum holothuriorum]
MKKILLWLLCISSLTISAQKDFQGKAIYQSKTKMNMDFGNRQMSEEQKKRIEQRMKSFSERIYILSFNTTESLYKEEERLGAPTGQREGRFQSMMSSFSNGVQYKNVKEKELLESKEFFGKKFLIEEKLETPKWEMTGETKQIGQYTCLKATIVKSIDDVAFRRFRPRRKGNNEEKKEQSSETKKEVTVTAWYTPQIPVSNGPGEYGGLPGLILEVNAGRTTILCSEIVLNPSEKQEIKKPTKGKKVTREEYDKIAKKKMEEMREMFQRRRGGNGRGRGRF